MSDPEAPNVPFDPFDGLDLLKGLDEEFALLASKVVAQQGLIFDLLIRAGVTDAATISAVAAEHAERHRIPALVRFMAEIAEAYAAPEPTPPHLRIVKDD